MEQKSTLTFNEKGRAITETVEGVEMPAEMSFECVNEFIHSDNVDFEDLQCLCLGMVTEIEKYKKQGKSCALYVDYEKSCDALRTRKELVIPQPKPEDGSSNITP